MVAQWLAVGLIVAVAAVYLARATWRTWFAAKGSCGGGCSCDAAGKASEHAAGSVTLIPAESLRVRKRS